ncbi:hypothetical protein [Microbacterium sp. H6]|nr:hypothetical protein [Microbacterium sp. H6]
MPEFAALDDAALTRIIERAAADSSMLSAKRPTGVLLVVLDTEGESSGSLAGLRTEWVLGEPVHQQDVPLGIEFTPSGCTVTTVR